MAQESGHPILGGDPERTICFCHNVPLGRLIREIEQGARTFEELQRITCCSTGCGGCEPEVCEILEAKLAEVAQKR